MLLLTLLLGVTGLGIAVYRERPQSWASVAAAQIATALLRPAPPGRRRRRAEDAAHRRDLAGERATGRPTGAGSGA